MPVTGGISVSRFGASSWSQTGGAGALQSVVSAVAVTGVSALAVPAGGDLCHLSSLQWEGCVFQKNSYWGGPARVRQMRGSVLMAGEGPQSHPMSLVSAAG